MCRRTGWRHRRWTPGFGPDDDDPDRDREHRHDDRYGSADGSEASPRTATGLPRPVDDVVLASVPRQLAEQFVEVTHADTPLASRTRSESSGASTRSRLSAWLVWLLIVPTETPRISAAAASLRSS